MPSQSARAYLVLQIFDHIDRIGRPVRVAALVNDLEDLQAWPSFRDDILYEPRLLVVGDAVDIATAGIHASAPVEDIVVQTLNLIRAPLSDKTLIRFIRRLRPDLSADCNPIDLALASHRVFRTRTGYLACREWLKGAKPCSISEDPPGSMAAVALSTLRRANHPLDAVGLAAALAERFETTITDAYQVLGTATDLLMLPGGLICIYDEMISEIAALCKTEGGDAQDEQSDEEADTAMPLPPLAGLDRKVAAAIRLSGAPIDTAEILLSQLGIRPQDAGYVAAFRDVSAFLGTSPLLVPVGYNRWHLVALVPDAVWTNVQRRRGSRGSGAGRTITADDFVIDVPAHSAAFRVSDGVLDSGTVCDRSFAELFPDSPLVQMYEVLGLRTPVWYNAENCTLYGLDAWFERNGIGPDDLISLSVHRATLRLTLVRRANTGFHRHPSRPIRHSGVQRRSVLSVIVDLLQEAGGVLDRDELVSLLNSQGISAEWDDIEPLFERLAVLRYEQGQCRLVQMVPGPAGTSPLTAREMIARLAGMPPEVRSDPRVVRLVDLVSSQPILSEKQELEYLIQGRVHKEQRDRVILGNLRYALSQLLSRRDLELLLPDLEDYFQACAIAVLRATEHHDLRGSARLRNYQSYYVLSELTRAQVDYLLPFRLPIHAINLYLSKVSYWIQERVVDEDEDWEVDSADRRKVERMVDYWAAAQWVSWEECSEQYEEGDLNVLDVVSGGYSMDPAAAVATYDLSRRTGELLSTLSRRDQEVFRLRFGLMDDCDLTLAAVGERMGVSRARVQQIVSRGLDRLRRNLARSFRDLRDYFA